MSNVLVVGNGNMGRNHARVLYDLGHRVRTLDPRMDAGADYDMLSTDLVEWTEVACIAVPIDELASHADAWINRGKDVLVEKPGATDVATLAYLHQRAEEQGVKFRVGYTERHNGAVHALADAASQIGTLRHISIRRLGLADSDIDPALNLACHDFDVLDALGFDMELQHASRVDGYLTATLTARCGYLFHQDVTISIEASHLHPVKVRTFEAIGTHGVLCLDYQRRTVTVTGSSGESIPVAVDDTEPLITEWRSFLDNGEGSSGTKALALVEATRNWPVFATLAPVAA